LGEKYLGGVLGKRPLGKLPQGKRTFLPKDWNWKTLPLVFKSKRVCESLKVNNNPRKTSGNFRSGKEEWFGRKLIGI